jgi:hypothetical protein
VIKFTQTTSSADADILVFFCDSLPGAVGMCNYPREANQPAIIVNELIRKSYLL